MSKDIKMCTTGDLIELARRGLQRNFNRTADPNKLFEALDPDGTHLLTLVLFGHNMDSAPIFHHRTEVLAKVKDTMDPAEFYLDIADSDWRILTPVPDEVRQ